MALGLGLFWAGVPIVALALDLYGAGIGLESIARATLPLALFGAANYAPIMGRLAMPSLIAQAAAPSRGAVRGAGRGAGGARGAGAGGARGGRARGRGRRAATAPGGRRAAES